MELFVQAVAGYYTIATLMAAVHSVAVWYIIVTLIVILHIALCLGISVGIFAPIVHKVSLMERISEGLRFKLMSFLLFAYLAFFVVGLVLFFTGVIRIIPFPPRP